MRTTMTTPIDNFWPELEMVREFDVTVLSEADLDAALGGLP